MWKWYFSGVREVRDYFNPRFASQQWDMVLSWDKELKKARIWLSSMPGHIGEIYFTKRWRAETLQPGSESNNFRPRLKSGIFNCISWLNCPFS